MTTIQVNRRSLTCLSDDGQDVLRLRFERQEPLLTAAGFPHLNGRTIQATIDLPPLPTDQVTPLMADLAGHHPSVVSVLTQDLSVDLRWAIRDHRAPTWTGRWTLTIVHHHLAVKAIVTHRMADTPRPDPRPGLGPLLTIATDWTPRLVGALLSSVALAAWLRATSDPNAAAFAVIRLWDAFPQALPPVDDPERWLTSMTGASHDALRAIVGLA